VHHDRRRANNEKTMRAVVNAFSVDVEDYFQVSALASAIPRDSWCSRELRVERNTGVLLDLLAERNLHGTFFVLGWIADRCPALVKRIAAAGHEVASHGYSHQLIYNQAPDEFREETTRSKHLLEDLISAPVIGYRAASFSITRQSLWALDVLIDLGFQYDSSVFPIHHDRYGIPDALPEPHAIRAPSGRTLAEFPMSAATFFGVKVPVSGGGYFRIFPYWLIRSGLKQINEQQQRPFTFYLHPWEVDPEQPRVKVGAVSRFRHYTNLDRCEPRLRRLLGEFEFSTMREVLGARGLIAQNKDSSDWRLSATRRSAADQSNGALTASR
jgi:polysaccharide deacetylase family protein (PEP-CTERM system associated)